MLGLTYLAYHIYIRDFLQEYEPWYQDSAEVSFYVFLLLFFWALTKTIFSDPGRPAKDCVLVNEQTTYCGVCQNIKPERYRP